jgi:hypothetical protein
VGLRPTGFSHPPKGLVPFLSLIPVLRRMYAPLAHSIASAYYLEQVSGEHCVEYWSLVLDLSGIDQYYWSR